MMTAHRIVAGDGYDYVIRQVAVNDAAVPGGVTLAGYYDEKGESPGVWLGSGLAGIEGLAEGDPVTAEQMKSLFGEGLHPLAAQRLAALGPNPTKQQVLDAVRLGRPFRQPDTDVIEFRVELGRRFVAWNKAHGHKAKATIPDDLRAAIRTDLAVEWFTAREGRRPDARELHGFLTKVSRKPSMPVAGFDLTFSPVKSVSAMWALLDPSTAAIVEAAHDAAVRDALRFIEKHALFTRTGRGGVEQVEVVGLVAAAFTHRDTRAGDPDLHTHVVVANKVQTVRDGQWRAIDSRVLYQAITAGSETYNTALERHLAQRLGWRFADTPRTDGRRPVREVVGVDPRLTKLWSRRRTEITRKAAELSAAFQLVNGRPPSGAERNDLYQAATLATREAKHAPRSRNEQRATWRAEADRELGRGGVDRMLAAVASQPPVEAPILDRSWFARSAEHVLAEVEQRRGQWQEHHVRAEVQRHARATGVPIEQLEEGVEQLIGATLGRSICLTPPGDDIEEPTGLRRLDGTSVYRRVGTDWYTSQRILGAEQRIIGAADRGGGMVASADSIETALLEELANGTPLNPGQIALVTGMATSGRRVQLALAPAGTGKTTAMRALTNAALDSGGHVLALAPTAAAATQLGGELPKGVHADTLHKLASELSQPTPADWAAAIGPNTLVIIDEAGMAETLILDQVIGRVLDLAGSVRLIGDDQQLGAIASGGVLRDIAAQHGALRLDDVVRFQTRAEASASLALRDGDPAALGFYLDHERVHVGDVDTALDGVFDAWLADKQAGLDALMLAPTRDHVAQLNARAREHRLDGHRPGREVLLSDDNHASVGDQVISRYNNRRLRVGDRWVQNGDRWIITKVGRDGSLDVRQPHGHRRTTLPADYVAEHVELGYTTTIHGAQGLTADTCHGLITGTESRQQAYTMLSRGRYTNHVWLQVTGDGDPHSRLNAEAQTPATATEILEAVLARDDSPISATSQLARAHDPGALLADAVDRYEDAIRAAAAEHAGPELAGALDAAADATGIPLTDADAWPVLKGHLLVLHANGWNPFEALAHAAQDPLGDARDPAAVLDYRLDVYDVRSHDTGRPLPWLPGVPTQLAGTSWDDYLSRRRDLIVRLADQAHTGTLQSGIVPAWAAALGQPPHAETVAEIEVWRAAHGIPDTDLRPTGPARHHVPEAREQHRLDALLAGKSEAVLAWLERIQQAAPDTVGDPSLIRAAREFATADPDGSWLPEHLAEEAGRPLPDDHKVDALRYRLEEWVNPTWETVEPSPVDLRRDDHRPPAPGRGIPR